MPLLSVLSDASFAVSNMVKCLHTAFNFFSESLIKRKIKIKIKIKVFRGGSQCSALEFKQR